MRILAISSSRAGSGGYLENAAPLVTDFIGIRKPDIAFIPFASVQNDYEAYAEKVRQALPTEYNITAVTPGNARKLIERTGVIMVGGGNTFKLLHDIYDLNIYDLIIEKVRSGTPYIGWSAGANIAGLTIGTTNDMPVIQPASFNALGFFPFQINPHYVNLVVPGHNGETRDQRLEEFLAMNPASIIVALPEGSALKMDEAGFTYIGQDEGILFRHNAGGQSQKEAIGIGQSLSFFI